LEYQSAPRVKKPEIAKHLVDNWRALDPPGRFLSKAKTGEMWEDIGDEAARRRTSKSLGERGKQSKSAAESSSDTSASTTSRCTKRGRDETFGDLPTRGNPSTELRERPTINAMFSNQILAFPVGGSTAARQQQTVTGSGASLLLHQPWSGSVAQSTPSGTLGSLLGDATGTDWDMEYLQNESESHLQLASDAAFTCFSNRASSLRHPLFPWGTTGHSVVRELQQQMQQQQQQHSQQQRQQQPSAQAAMSTTRNRSSSSVSRSVGCLGTLLLLEQEHQQHEAINVESMFPATWLQEIPTAAELLADNVFTNDCTDATQGPARSSTNSDGERSHNHQRFS
jgi:hypothetical protein